MVFQSPRVVCLADDLTGLAEIAALAADNGIKSTVWFNPSAAIAPSPPMRSSAAGVVCVNLACRALSGSQARERLVQTIRYYHTKQLEHVYLKLDSAARGPIGWMLQGLIDAFSSQRIPLVLCNPETGRRTRQGLQWVDDQLLHESAFSGDPLHPISESFVPHLIQEGLRIPAFAEQDLTAGAAEQAVVVPDAQSLLDIDRLADRWRPVRAAAGAAPFGLALMKRWTDAAVAAQEEPHPVCAKRLLVVVGTRSKEAGALIEEFGDMGGAVQEVGDYWRQGAGLPLLIHPPRDEGDPERILCDLTEKTVQIFESTKPTELLILGGETAQALFSALNCHTARAMGYRCRIARLRTVVPEIGGQELGLCLLPGSYYEPRTLEKLFVLSRDQTVNESGPRGIV